MQIRCRGDSKSPAMPPSWQLIGWYVACHWRPGNQRTQVDYRRALRWQHSTGILAATSESPGSIESEAPARSIEVAAFLDELREVASRDLRGLDAQHVYAKAHARKRVRVNGERQLDSLGPFVAVCECATMARKFEDATARADREVTGTTP